MSDEFVNPWDRQPWDTPASYAMFRDFYLKIERYKRSVTLAYRNYLKAKGKPTVRKNGELVQVTTTWRYWSTGYNAYGKKPAGSVFEHSLTWAERARAWDDKNDEAWENEWLSRKKAIREQEFEIAQKLIRRGESMLDAPLFRRTETDGGATVIIEPADWGELDIVRIFDLAVKLGRRSAEMETQRMIVDWREEVRKSGIDPDAAFQRLVESLEQELNEGAE